MGYLFSGIVFAALSVVVTIAMARVTNEKIASCSEEDAAQVIPYEGSFTDYVFLVCIIAVSALCGGLIWQNAISGVAIVKLALCYFGVLAAAVIDRKLRIIPNFIPVTLIGARVLIFLYELIFGNGAMQEILFSLIGCLLCGLFLLLSNKLSKGGIGGGDVKLLACIGLLCGAYVVFTALLLALLCCCVVAVLGIASRKLTLKNSVPFGPFIYLGYVLMCLMTLY